VAAKHFKQGFWCGFLDQSIFSLLTGERFPVPDTLPVSDWPRR
jgi:hypothetical protein